MKGRYLARYRSASHWVSCRSITNLLEKRYPDFAAFYQDESILLAPDLEYLAITDHRWLSELTLKQLKAVRNVRIDWYVFGDFTLKIPLFKKHLDALNHLKLKIIVASEAQKELLLNIFPEAKTLLEVQGYPSESLFKRSEEARDDTRKTYALTSGEKLFGYVGRISPQKGILELMQVFLRHERQLNAKLVLAGPIDPHPFWQFSDEEDAAFLPSFRKLMALSEGSITWIPWINHDELARFYSGLDLFISPSFFHDEDFGLAPSEALACGVKCILTEWGGYKRFRNHPEVRLVGMEKSEKGYRVHLPSLEKAILNFENAPVVQEKSLKLTSEERDLLLREQRFLSQGGKFNEDIYYKIYEAYV